MTQVLEEAREMKGTSYIAGDPVPCGSRNGCGLEAETKTNVVESDPDNSDISETMKLFRFFNKIKRANINTEKVPYDRVPTWIRKLTGKAPGTSHVNITELHPALHRGFETLSEDRFEFRPCQLEALKACKHSCGRDCTIEMACGSGKSWVIYNLTKSTRGKVLLLVPSILLMEQYHKDYFHDDPEVCLVGTGHKANFSCRVFICVYPSARLLADIRFHTIIFDEAHHTRPTDGSPNAKQRYFFSATHTLLEPIYTYTLRQAIDDEVACDFDIVIPEGQGNNTAELVKLLSRHTERFRHVIVYCQNISEASKFNNAATDAGLISQHVNGKTPKAERQEVLDAFKNGSLRVLIVVGLLQEGVNLPNADTVVFTVTTKSYIKLVQALGRGIRQTDTKTMAHLILPPVREGVSEALKGRMYQNLLTVDQGLRFDHPWRVSSINLSTWKESCICDRDHDAVRSLFPRPIRKTFEEGFQKLLRFIKTYGRLPRAFHRSQTKGKGKGKPFEKGGAQKWASSVTERRLAIWLSRTISMYEYHKYHDKLAKLQPESPLHKQFKRWERLDGEWLEKLKDCIENPSDAKSRRCSQFRQANLMRAQFGQQPLDVTSYAKQIA